MLASEFGDDYDAIPAYEQIYALAGPTQTYRITGDPRILQRHRADARAVQQATTCDREQRRLLLAHRPDHLRPAQPRSLGRNQARKNWNSVGDHAPAYLINLCLATGEQTLRRLARSTRPTPSPTHFPDYDNSPFVQEKFHEDWSQTRPGAGSRTARSSGTT